MRQRLRQVGERDEESVWTETETETETALDGSVLHHLSCVDECPFCVDDVLIKCSARFCAAIPPAINAPVPQRDGCANVAAGRGRQLAPSLLVRGTVPEYCRYLVQNLRYIHTAVLFAPWPPLAALPF